MMRENADNDAHHPAMTMGPPPPPRRLIRRRPQAPVRFFGPEPPAPSAMADACNGCCTCCTRVAPAAPFYVSGEKSGGAPTAQYSAGEGRVEAPRSRPWPRRAILTAHHYGTTP